MSILAQLISIINQVVNAVGGVVLGVLALMPGWLGNSIAAALTGLVAMVIFKYTSNQDAIGRVRDNIKAQMLVLKLYKDSIAVTLQAQGRLFKSAILLLVHSMRPMLVMIVPVWFILGQMGLLYQFRPLQPGEETIVTVSLNDSVSETDGSAWPKVEIEPTESIETSIGPVRSIAAREISWKIKAIEPGVHEMVIAAGDTKAEKKLTIGEGLMRISAKRPGLLPGDIAIYPLEKPFSKDSIIQSISIDYPERTTFLSGSSTWLGWFFVFSFIFAFAIKPIIKVKI
jgi:uncharacterized membrane protein (DUF106 family)